MDSDPVQIKFTKNGELIDKTIEISREELAEKTLFPHVLTRNVKFVVNFGESETKYTPEEVVQLVSKLEPEKRVRGPQRPSARTDCEVSSPIRPCFNRHRGITQNLRFDFYLMMRNYVS